jgi:hypothetical protein
MRRFSGSSVLSSSHCVRKEGLLRRLTRLRLRKIGRASLEVASQVVLLEEEVDVYSPPAGIENRLRDGLRIELLHGDVEGVLCPGDEGDDDRLEVVGRA